tara:strand:- start:125 stop:742 length:618 start_codon:yes stop_codon:yes gene_type:complete
MNRDEVLKILQKNLKYSDNSLRKIISFHEELLIYNNKYNLISKSTEKDAWQRHILDSAQLVKYIDFKKSGSLSDLGTGGGFPGIVLAIFNENINFHVKLYEKSRVKCIFLKNVVKKLDIKAKILEGSYIEHEINSNYIICRAFKKFPQILKISREIAKKPHRLIILKGKNAQDELNKATMTSKFEYKLENSITDKESKIVLLNVR